MRASLLVLLFFRRRFLTNDELQCAYGNTRDMTRLLSFRPTLPVLCLLHCTRGGDLAYRPIRGMWETEPPEASHHDSNHEHSRDNVNVNTNTSPRPERALRLKLVYTVQRPTAAMTPRQGAEATPV